jgi:hypothetical protein
MHQHPPQAPFSPKSFSRSFHKAGVSSLIEILSGSIGFAAFSLSFFDWKEFNHSPKSLHLDAAPASARGGSVAGGTLREILFAPSAPDNLTQKLQVCKKGRNPLKKEDKPFRDLKEVRNV